MRILFFIFTIGLLGPVQLVCAAPLDNRLSGTGQHMTGSGDMRMSSVKGLVRERGRALLALLAGHMRNRMQVMRMRPTHLNAGNEPVSRLSELREELIGFDASIALGAQRRAAGGMWLTPHRRYRAVLSATPRRAKLVFKISW